MRCRREAPTPLLLAALLLFAAWIAVGQSLAAREESWIVRGGVLRLSPAADEIRAVAPGVEQLPEERTRFGLSDGGGVGVALEYLATRRIGLEVTALFGDHDSEFVLETDGLRLMDREDIGFKAFFLGANYHFTPGRRMDFSAGAFAGLSYYDDVIFLAEAGRRHKRTFDDDLGYGVKVGIDVPFKLRGPWIFSAELRYLSTILEGEVAGQDLDLNPLISAIGIGYRF